MAVESCFIYYLNPLKNKHIYDATLYISLLKPFIQVLMSEAPITQRTVKSKYSFNQSGEPVDISYIDTTVRKCLRVALLRKYLVSRSEKLAVGDQAYIQNMALLSTELFNWDNPGSFDLLVEGSEFFKIAELLGDFFVILYSYSFIRNPLYQNAYRLFKDHVSGLTLTSDLSKLESVMAETDLAAEELVKFIDQYLIASQSRKPASLPSFSLNSNRGGMTGSLFKDFPFNATSTFSTMEVENVLGFNVTYKFVPPVANLNNFNKIVRVDKASINRLYETFQLIKSQHLVHHVKPFEQTGAIDIENFYRRFSDCLVFEDEYKKVSLSTRFNLLFLFDNSCSINDNKKRLMQAISSLLLLTVKDFPEIFSQLVAYAQNTEGTKVVALRKLADCKVQDIRNMDRILHIQSTGVNHDVFALHKVLRLHEKQLFQRKSTKTVAIIIGDAWPISVAGNVQEEQEVLMQNIRQRFKDLIIIYVAIDENRHPRDLSYDYFIRQKSEDFSLSYFLHQFTAVIKHIISKYNQSCR